MSDLSVVITGGLHGVGAEIVDRFAQEQCKISIIANSKSVDMEKVTSLFSEYRKMGSDVRIIPTDIMSESDVVQSVEKVAANNGGVIDVCINAAMISHAMGYQETTPDKLDLFYKINAKSSYVMMRAAYAHLKKSHNPHVLNIAPPINLDPKIMGFRTAYTITQYLRSMITISMANTEQWKGIACNAIWPVAPFCDGSHLGIYQSHINTSNNLKSVKLFSEAVYGVVTQPSDRYTGEFFYDEEVLEMLGVSLDAFQSHAQSNDYAATQDAQEPNYNAQMHHESVPEGAFSD